MVEVTRKIALRNGPNMALRALRQQNGGKQRRKRRNHLAMDLVKNMEVSREYPMFCGGT